MDSRTEKGHTGCASLTSKEDDDIFVLLLHPLDDISRLLGFSHSIGSGLSRPVSISHRRGFCPELAFREISERGKGDKDEDDEIRCV